MPPRPEKPSAPEKPRPSLLPLLLAGVLFVMVFVALFFLTLGWAGPVLVIGMLIFGMGAFHYVVWGWWLSGLIREQEADAEESSGKPAANKEV